MSSGRGKKLTRDQKIQLSELGLSPEEFRMIRDLNDRYVLRNKETGEITIANKDKGGRR